MATPPSSTDRWTRADLDQLPDDGHRRELVDGELLMSPLARRRHQWVVTQITVALELWSRADHGIVYPGVNVDLDPRTHLEPDVAWSADTDTSGEGFTTVPELIVEVSSPSTKRFDGGVKRLVYLASGAHEVWLVDLDTDTIEQHRPGPAVPVVHHHDEVLTTPLLPGFALDVDRSLGRVR